MTICIEVREGIRQWVASSPEIQGLSYSADTVDAAVGGMIRHLVNQRFSVVIGAIHLKPRE